MIFCEYIPSKSGIKKAIKKGRFFINGKQAETANWINSGQVIELAEQNFNPKKVFSLALPIIYEDEFMAAVNKPPGLIVSGNYYKTLVNALPFNLKKSNEPDALSFATPVHRIDRATSGIVLIAKTKTAQIELSKQFENRTIQKKYCTISIGKIHSNRTIKTPIEEKEAETEIEIIKIVKSLKFKDLSCLKITPKTGRSHQIRIHLASINHPILGDQLYGNNLNHKGKGLFLCASEIIFLHPKTFKKIHLKIPIPHKFKSMLVRERRRWNTHQLLK
ncbi:MAG: RluA family pseudouridine synthase [Lutibacter sp.]